MDAESERRWRQGLPPFDGVILRQEEQSPLSALQPILAAIVVCLYEEHGDTNLSRLADWHEHDGYVIEPNLSSWDELRLLVSSPSELRAASTGDTYVSTAFFPDDRTFYLRIYVLDQYDRAANQTGDWGEFDLTGSESLIERAATAALAAGAVTLIQDPAREYFDQTWSG